MTSLDSLFPDITDPAVTDRLRARLGAAAAADGLLDVAYRTLDTPVGRITIAATPVGVVRVALPNQPLEGVLADLAERVSPRILHAAASLDAISHQIDDYFSGSRHHFELPLDMTLAHGFRRTVLDELRHVPYGQTASYADLAAAAGNPRAVRATGTACATNPIPIVIPCHRITRSDGTLGNYGGGQDVKRALLLLEGAIHDE